VEVLTFKEAKKGQSWYGRKKKKVGIRKGASRKGTYRLPDCPGRSSQGGRKLVAEQGEDKLGKGGGHGRRKAHSFRKGTGGKPLKHRKGHR